MDDCGKAALGFTIVSGRATALLSMQFLTQPLNAKSLKNIVNNTLAKCGLDPNKFIRLACVDNASYGVKAVKDLRAALWDDMRRNACMAHIINLAGEDFQDHFELIDSLIKAWILVFNKSNIRPARWSTYVMSNKPNWDGAILPPFPGQTRWSSWFRMVLWIESIGGIQFIRQYFITEQEYDKPNSLVTLVGLMASPDQVRAMDYDIAFISKVGGPLVKDMPFFL